MHQKQSFVHTALRSMKCIAGASLPLALLAFFVALGLPSKKGQAAPFPSCDTKGILFQYPGGANTQVHEIDMVTGDDTQPAGSPISNRTINAAGYNTKDNYLYGWDDTQDTLVRIHSDETTENLTISGYSGPTSGIIIGDVDDNGHYWFIGGSNWYEVDLTSTTPSLLNSGSAAGVTGSAGADWAFIPGTNKLYRIMDNAGTEGRLWSFDRTTHTWTDVGALPDITGANLTMGAFYADNDGFLYGSSNTTGNIWRVDVNAVTADLFATGPASSSNDGARCATAGIPIDFSDAPSSYSTLLGDDGPRHSVANYNDGSDTAPLMLGKKIDIETDGFPGAGADGDDNDNIDDELGVTHIVVTPGTPTALSVPVTVTNTSSQTATLAGWVDLDDDGMFESGERVTATIPANTGTAVYSLAFPSATFTSDSYARFRVFGGAVADPQPTGSATGGEVEDVLVQVGSYHVTKTSNPADGSVVGTGDTITYTLTFKNTGTTDLTDLTFYDDLSAVLDDASFQGAAVNPGAAGTAALDGSTLQFAGDIATGQTVTVTYSVKVNSAASLGDKNLKNIVRAAHSNCHPQISGTTITVNDPDCSTQHTVGSLADTGSNIFLPLAGAGGILGASGLTLILGTNPALRRRILQASQK